MTLNQFNLLNEDDQACAIWQRGVLIATRASGSCRVLLYQIEGFYVEVFYQPQYHVITKFKSFASTDALDPYFGQISLSGLLENQQR